MTTYATTYGWRSTGVRRDLVTSPSEQNLVNRGRRGRTGVYGIADPITTNQKVAGSSPAERAPYFSTFCSTNVGHRLRSLNCSLGGSTGYDHGDDHQRESCLDHRQNLGPLTDDRGVRRAESSALVEGKE